MTGNTDEEAAASRLVRRRRTVLTPSAAAVVLSVGGLLGSGRVQSPSQAAADTRQPKASVITATVVRQVPRSAVVLRGTFSDRRTVSAAPTSVATTTVPSQPARLMVTGVYAHPGQNVGAGRVLVEFSGRPVFALKGALPACRDLTFGEQGKDVARLQSALRSLGHPTGSDARGVFSPGTEHGARRMYDGLGYPAPVSTARADAVPDGKPAAPADRSGTPGADGGSADKPADPPPTPAAPVTHAMVPTSEAVFVPTLPARVVSVPVRVGDPVKGGVVTLARGGMTLTGRLDPARAGLVTAGMKARVLAEATGAQADGTVESVGAPMTPGGDAAAGDDKDGDGAPDTGPAPPGGDHSLPLTIRPAKAWDTRFAGQDVRITISTAATDSAVLAVPVAAISAGAGTRTTVTVVSPAGTQRVLQVTAGVSADGTVAVTPVDNLPAVFVDGTAYTVVGVLSDVRRLPQMLLGMVVPTSTALRAYGPPVDSPAQALIHTLPGAGRLIAHQAPLALRPDKPQVFTAVPSPDPHGLRDEVGSDLSGLFLIRAAVCLVVGAVGIANTTLAAVLERTGEIGLRRALGARPRHITARFLTESTVLGALGGLIGTGLGISTVVGTALARNWTAVLQPYAVLPAPLIGALTGFAAGLYPAPRAAGTEPLAALRR
ncbi:ABC transporter permease [Actinacidiphila sp. ITFR-21]|uniref:ABC transporter permease n=1 Tax=Actinacidiphila sp. ITFR-21 TaxID=3075199 RepID=UPI0028899969|nr:ABC transporter permease [Streptomyces sp. ITFR-21]WNI16185.1 ABC transporter permease [Streptomyces sp. ITFR-21]